MPRAESGKPVDELDGVVRHTPSGYAARFENLAEERKRCERWPERLGVIRIPSFMTSVRAGGARDGPEV